MQAAMKITRSTVNCLAVLVTILGCAEDQQRGGDHVPELKTYKLTELPPSSVRSGTPSRNFPRSEVLKSLVHLAPLLQICLTDEFSDENLIDLQEQISNHGIDTAHSGLEAVLARAFRTLGTFDQSRKNSTHAQELRVVRATSTSCDLTFDLAETNEFPFTEEDFSDEDSTLFQSGQLRDEKSQVNKSPLAFIRASANLPVQKFHLELIIARYLGLNESDEVNSRLNPKSDPESADLRYFFRAATSKELVSNDELTIYAYVAAYLDRIRPSDLASFQHYADILMPRSPETDPLMKIPAGVDSVSFKAVVGSEKIIGVRKLSSEQPFQLCFQSGEGVSVKEDWLARYVEFGDFNAEKRRNKSLFFHLHDADDKFVQAVSLGNQSCNGLVELRTSLQYPFTDRPNNGLYAHESRIKTSANEIVLIPVIYINVSNLELDPENQTSSKKYIGTVIEHEFAHLMGFRHSSSSASLLSPAGYNDALAMPTPDGEMLKSWLREFATGEE